jgi:uncharacterized tellurite resistance protein B-like protein
MFVEHLTPSERLRLLRLLTYLAAVDGDIDPSEDLALRALAERIGVPDGTPDLVINEVGLEQLCRAFERESARRIALAELVGMALADQEFAWVEKRTLGKVATAFGVDPATLESIERWVEEGLRWKHTAVELLALEEEPIF